MRVRVILHGQRARAELEVDVETAYEALEALGTQLRPYDDLPLELRPAVRVVGFPTLEDLQAPLPADTRVLHLVPAMRGGNGKFFKTLLVAGLLVVAGALLGGPIGAGLILAGIATAVSGVVGLFMPTPKASKGPSDPEASKYFGSNTNTVAIGTPIGIAYGRCVRFGHILSINVDAQDMVRGQFPASP